MNSRWFSIFAQAAPWLTVAFLCVMMGFLSMETAPAPALGIELPDPGCADSAEAGLVALLIPDSGADPGEKGSILYFDDARYMLDDPSNAGEFAACLSDMAGGAPGLVLTLLADRRVPLGDAMRVMTIARSCGIARVQIAERGE